MKRAIPDDVVISAIEQNETAERLAIALKCNKAHAYRLLNKFNYTNLWVSPSEKYIIKQRRLLNKSK